MTTERDPTILLDVWLEEGPLEMPLDTRRAIETAVRTMPQRRRGFGRSWRFPPVPALLRPIAVIGLIVILGAGVALFAGARPPTPPITQPSPTPLAHGGPVGRLILTPHDGITGEPLGLYVMNADGSDQHVISVPLDSEGAWWSPDGRAVLLGNSFKDGKWRPALVEPDGSGYRRIDVPGDFQDMYCGVWTPDGATLLCGIQSTTDPSGDGVVTVDVASGAIVRHLTTGANPSVNGSEGQCGGGDYPAAISPDGTQFLYIRHTCGDLPNPNDAEKAELYVGSVGGGTKPDLLLENGAFERNTRISWSSDGRRVLYAFDGRLWTVEPDGTNRTMIDVDVPVATYIHDPVWSPDRAWVAFGAMPQRDTDDLYIARSDGSDVLRLTNTLANEGAADWGPTNP
jgi:Tol biopolymer transport system component